jgi:hypothetical protein
MSGARPGRREPRALFAQADLNFETLIALGSAGYGTSEVGEIITAVNAINAAGPGYQTYYDVFVLGITGWSMCGESVVRAAAFEHRLAAVVADPGVRNAWLAFPEIIRRLFRGGAPKAEVNHIWNAEIVPALTPDERYTFAKRSGARRTCSTRARPSRSTSCCGRACASGSIASRRLRARTSTTPPWRRRPATR